MDMHWALINIHAMVLYNSSISKIVLYVAATTDIDECIEGTAECDTDASCNNTIGGYNCSCNSGYEGDGFRGNCKSELLLMLLQCHS